MERSRSNSRSTPRRPAVAHPAFWRAGIALGMLAAAGLSLMLVSVKAAPREKAANDPLADDARLSQKVKVVVEGLPVGDLLRLLSAKTGVALAASRETSEDKVVIFGPARPLREVLADLAALFNDRWERKKAADHSDHYLLTRDLAARQYEISLSQAVTERMMAELADQVKALGETPEQLIHRPDDDPVRQRLSDPKGRLATRLYGLLSQAQREALFARGRLTIPFSLLTPEQQAPIRAVFSKVITEEEAINDEETKAGFPEPVSQPKDLEQAGFRFEITRYPAASWVALLLGRSRIPIAMLDNRVRWLLPPCGNPYTGEKVAADAPLPNVSASHAAAAGRTWTDRLRKLSAASDVVVMADYYRGRPITKPYDDPSAYQSWGIEPVPGPAAGPADPAASALEALCEPDGYLWWMRGKTLLLRKRDWYEQQRYEVPDRWILEMAARLKAQHGIPTYADVLRVLELTPEQTIGLNGLGQPATTFGLAGQLRELLAIVQAAPKALTAPLAVIDQVSPQAWQRLWIEYSALSRAQRGLLAGFLDAYPYPVPPGEATEFRARLFVDPDEPARNARMMAQIGAPPTTDPDYHPVAVVLQFSLGDEHRLWGNFLSLPTSLPDDRRDRTKIEVVP